MAGEKQVILTQQELAKAITRMSHEVLEKAGSFEELTLIGIRSRGVHIARRLARKIEDLTEHLPPVGVIDVTLFRDDKTQTQASATPTANELSVILETKVAVL